MAYNLKLFSGTANRPLSEEIAACLNLSLSGIKIDNFADGEIFVQINESVRGDDVYIIQSTSNPGPYNFMELLIIIDALKRASAERITAVLPYFGFARQDRKDRPRVPITAKLVANLISTAGVDRVLTMDLHTDQIQGFFDIPIDHIFAAPVFIDYIKKLNLGDPVVVAPDPGAVPRTRFLGNRINASLAIIDKKREEKNVSEALSVIGDVMNKSVIIVDDIVDTAGTLVNSAKILKKQGAKRIIACCTHPVLSKNAIERIENSDIEKLIVTNTINLKNSSKKIEVLSVAELFAKAIHQIHKEESVSTLFLM